MKPKQKTIKKIAYISGTRADFGLMTSILCAIQRSNQLRLQIFVTGLHLMPAFGSTVKEVKNIFPDAKIIPATFVSDDRAGAARFTGQFLSRVSVALQKHRPDLVLLLGDRAEMLCTALACLYLGIPTAHVHGGDKTTTVDETARHAITKLAQLHFPATKAAARRIERMGEDRFRIHVVGAPTLDTILHEALPSREAVCRAVGLDPKQPFILVTQHPVSEAVEQAAAQMTEILAAVKKFYLPAVVIYPNADPGGRAMIRVIQKERRNPLFRLYPSLEYHIFLALEREAAAWVGNSSAAMIESASFHVPVVNVGDRQSGREHGANVINVPAKRRAIAEALRHSLYDENYRHTLRQIRNPWGDGKTGQRVAKILAKLKLGDRLMYKQLTY